MVYRAQMRATQAWDMALRMLKQKRRQGTTQVHKWKSTSCLTHLTRKPCKLSACVVCGVHSRLSRGLEGASMML